MFAARLGAKLCISRMSQPTHELCFACKALLPLLFCSALPCPALPCPALPALMQHVTL